jgi:hypothetical protein
MGRIRVPIRETPIFQAKVKATHKVVNCPSLDFLKIRAIWAD